MNNEQLTMNNEQLTVSVIDTDGKVCSDTAKCKIIKSKPTQSLQT